jgi:hypothetical protein
MQKKGLVKMVPHKLALYAQTESTTKDRDDNYVKFATNPDFVMLKSLKKSYHKLSGLAGDGYRVSSTGQVNFPMVYYAWKGDLTIACSRQYMTYKEAKKHLDNGTRDIIGRQTVYWGIKTHMRITDISCDGTRSWTGTFNTVRVRWTSATRPLRATRRCYLA